MYTVVLGGIYDENYALSKFNFHFPNAYNHKLEKSENLNRARATQTKWKG